MQCPKLRRSAVAMIWGCRCPIPLILMLTSNASIGVAERTRHSRQWRGCCAHLFQIPFENFDILLGRGVRLDLDSVQAKLVQAHRGGYCYEHATLFAAVLEKLGFQTVRHAARVILFAPITGAPRTHMFLTVELHEGTFVVDPGFGPFGSRVPIPLLDGAAAHGDYETHWMIRDGNRWMLRAELGGKLMDAWVTTLEQDNPVDFEM